MAERNLGEPIHGINVDSPDNIVQTAGKGAAETVGYDKAERAKIPAPKVADKDLHVKGDFNIDARNMTETLRGNHTQTTMGSETRTVTGASTQTTTGPVTQNNNGGKTSFTNNYDNSVIYGVKNSLNMAGTNTVTSEAFEAALAVVALYLSQEQKIAFSNNHYVTKNDLAVDFNKISQSNNEIHEIHNQTHLNHNETHVTHTAKHETYLAQSGFQGHYADLIIFDEA